MNRIDNVFVLVEDPVAPQRADLLQPHPEGQAPPPITGPGAPGHFRTTFLTLSPPDALEHLLSQLRARWVSVRQSGAAGTSQLSHTGGQQLSVDGRIFSIGTDFVVRIGNVILAGGAVKGMLLEVCLLLSPPALICVLTQSVPRRSTCRYPLWLRERMGASSF